MIRSGKRTANACDVPDLCSGEPPDLVQQRSQPGSPCCRLLRHLPQRLRWSARQSKGRRSAHVRIVVVCCVLEAGRHARVDQGGQ